MFSSFVAQAQRTRGTCGLAFMDLAVSLPTNSSLLFRRRDKPRLLPDKMMRSMNRTPAVHRIRGICIPGNDGSGPNRRKQRENPLPSRGIPGDESRHFIVQGLYDDPYAREMRPI